MRLRFISGAAAVCLAALGLASCRSAPTAAFEPQAAEFINTQGKGVIDGHAFYRSDASKVVYAAGEYAYLIPVTPYAEQRFFQIYGKGKYAQAKHLPWDASDETFRKYMRSTKTESNGRFKFENVGPGDYFVASSVTWQAEDSFTVSGAAIYERVSLSGKESEPVKVIVSGK